MKEYKFWLLVTVIYIAPHTHIYGAMLGSALAIFWAWRADS